MSKKHKFLSCLLAFCLCFAISVPALAAEADIEAQAMSRLAGFEFAQTANANEATVSVDGENIRIQNMSETATLDELNKAELVDMLDQIAAVKAEEMDDKTDIINYFNIADDKIYFYEEAAEGIDDVESKLLIYDIDSEASKAWADEILAAETEMDMNAEATADEDEIMPLASNSLTIYNRTSPLDKGVAARLNINNSAITYMQSSVTVPTIAQMSGVNNTSIFNYIYIGFSGTNVESDIGLASARESASATSLCGFKPYFLLKNNGTTNNGAFSYENTSDEGVKYYLPSTNSASRTIDLVVYKSVNVDGVNRIRGTVYGLAVYGSANKQGYVKTIMDSEKTTSSQLASISKWKAVNTLSPSSGSVPSGTKSQCVFKNFLVNGNNLALSACNAEIYNRGNTNYGSVSATYKNTNYLNTLTFILKP